MGSYRDITKSKVVTKCSASFSVPLSTRTYTYVLDARQSSAMRNPVEFARSVDRYLQLTQCGTERGPKKDTAPCSVMPAAHAEATHGSFRTNARSW